RQDGTSLGIDGFTYADLHSPARLRDLYERFCRQVEVEAPDLWAAWDAYRQNPDAPMPATERSDLIVRMAPHVSRFIAALFRVDEAAGELRTRTRALEALFRF